LDDVDERGIEMGTVFGNSAHEIYRVSGSALNVLETDAMLGESHIPILVPLSYRSPADGVLAYRVRSIML
jgi:hypothetical protein